MRKIDRKKGEIFNKCGKLALLIVENDNGDSFTVSSGYQPITGNDKRSHL